MKPKEYFKKQRFFNGVKEIYETLYPLLRRITKPVKRFFLSHPARTATLMFAVLLLNTAALFIIIYHKNSSKQHISYSSIMKNFKNKNSAFEAIGTGNSISLGSFIEIKNIRDSLEYLMHKKVQTKEDTLCFLRLYKRYSLIDPSIKPPHPPKGGLSEDYKK